MEKIFIRDIKNLKEGDRVEGFFVVRKKESIQTYTKGYYFKISVSDKTDITGKFNIVFWGTQNNNEVEKIYNSFDEGDVIFVCGKVGMYDNEIRINVNLPEGIIRKATENEYNISDLLPVTNQNIEKMENELREIINGINNKFLKKLLLKFFDDEKFMEKFRKWPGSILYHHACIGGLMEHTLEVVRLCKAISDIHPTGINRDLMITGAILHDIGKIETINIMNVGFSRDNEEDILRGHISMAEEMVLQKIYEIEAEDKNEKFPEGLKHELLHIILSHHSTKGQGKEGKDICIEPATPEAAAVHASDYFSSSVTQYIRAIKDNDENVKTKYVKPIGRVYMEKKMQTENLKK